MELKQETLFQSYLEQKVEKEQRRKRLRTIVETARKVIFVQADEIRWDAAVWYLDRFHIAKERRNQSDMYRKNIVSGSFVSQEPMAASGIHEV